MTKDGLLVADSDMHIFEPPDLWQRYIAPEWRHAAPVGLTELRRDMRVKVKSHVILRLGTIRPSRPGDVWKASQESPYTRAEQQGWDPASQKDAMDQEGLDVAVLFPTRGLFVLGLDTKAMMGTDGLEPELAAAIARGYNDWLADYCKESPERMFGAAMVAPHDIDVAGAPVRLRANHIHGIKHLPVRFSPETRRTYA